MAEDRRQSFEISGSDVAALAVIDELTRARLRSNQFFILINSIIAMVNFASGLFCVWAGHSQAVRYYGIAMSITLTFASIIICMFWIRSNREFSIQHETRFMALMDHERIYTDRGILSRTWDRIGDYPNRNSPIMMVSFTRYMPMLFMLINIVPPYTLILISFVLKTIANNFE